jgi:hypothetical protein
MGALGVFGLVIIGGGAAGTGPLVWAAQHGKLESWLGEGIVIVERSGRLGGDIGRYVLNADSLGTSFIECLDSPAARALFPSLATDAATLRLRQARNEHPTLALVGQYLCSLGAAVQSVVARHRASAILPYTRALSLKLGADGTVGVTLSSGETLAARAALVSPGGRQDMALLCGREIVPGFRLTEIAQEKIVSTEWLVTEPGIARVDARLAAHRRPKVVILGGSHSAFASAWVLLNKLSYTQFGTGDIVLLYRRPPRVFYPTREAACADGYAFSERDVCPATGRVHRMGGLRNDGRTLWRCLSGRPETAPEPRIRMMAVGDPALGPAGVRQLCRDAALIVPALGYRINTLPVFDTAGRRLSLMADAGGPAVDGMSRLLLRDGETLPNVFAVGLGSGYRPWGQMSGEPSFDGQQNSLWLYQHGLGQLIYENVSTWLERRPANAPRARVAAMA